MTITARSTTTTIVVGALSVFIGACAAESDVGEARQALQTPEGWTPPASVLAMGDTHSVDRDEAGSTCTSGLTDGASALKGYLMTHFPHLPEVQGFNCRSVAGSTNLSVHSVGRALDIMIPPVGNDDEVSASDADNELGDPIANWLIENAEAIGIQYIVWDRNFWSRSRSPGSRFGAYTGVHPHDNHIHVELTIEGGAMETPFFQAGMQPPDSVEACEPIPAAGSVLPVFGPCVDFRDEVDPSFRAWRTVPGGLDGAMRWTGGWDGENPEATVDYALSFDRAGEYEIEVYLDPSYAEFPTTRYTVHHNGGMSVVDFDQGAGEGWTSLGVFSFDAGAPYAVALQDNQPDPTVFVERARIAADAMRVTPTGAGEPEDPTDSDDDSSVEPVTSQPDVYGGCAAASSGAAGPGRPVVLAMLIGLVGLGRRRRSATQGATRA